MDHNKTPKVKPGTILEPGRVACPYCATVQFIRPFVKIEQCPGCQKAFEVQHDDKGSAVRVLKTKLKYEHPG